MPFISYEAGRVTDDQKKDLIRALTKTASEITSIPESSFTVLIKENPINSWGIGGISLEEIMKKK